MNYLTAEQKAEVEFIRTVVEKNKTGWSLEEETALQIDLFDWSYDYSDCGATWRAGVATEQRLTKLVEEVDLPEEVKNKLRYGLGKSNEAQAKFREFYPFLKYRYIKDLSNNAGTGPLGAALAGVTDIEYEEAMAFLNKLNSVFKRLPPSHGGFFVQTYSTPNMRDMRRVALEGEGDQRYFGIAIPLALEPEVYSLFTSLTDRLVSIITNHRLYLNTEERVVTGLYNEDCHYFKGKGILSINSTEARYRFYWK